jgi:hypothetical protein
MKMKGLNPLVALAAEKALKKAIEKGFRPPANTHLDVNFLFRVRGTLKTGNPVYRSETVDPWRLLDLFAASLPVETIDEALSAYANGLGSHAAGKALISGREGELTGFRKNETAPRVTFSGIVESFER